VGTITSRKYLLIIVLIMGLVVGFGILLTSFSLDTPREFWVPYGIATFVTFVSLLARYGRIKRLEQEEKELDMMVAKRTQKQNSSISTPHNSSENRV